MHPAKALKLLYIIFFAGFTFSPSVSQAKEPDLNLYRSNIQQLKKNLSSSPHDPNLHFNLANNFWKLGQYRDAITHYKSTLKIQPFDSEAHTGIGWAH